MWCQKRITYKALEVKFGDGKHRFYLESVCAAGIDQGQKLCNECLNKSVQTKTQDTHTFPHGLVSGPYTKESHMYDSDWYKAKVATYGEPTDAILEVAMQAQGLARTGKGIRKPEDATATIVLAPAPVPVVTEPEKPKAKKGVRNPKEETEKKEKNTQASKPRAPKKSLKAPVSEPIVETKNVLLPIQQVPLEAPVETMDDPISVSDIIQVILRPFSHGTGKYWRDGERDKVYKRTADGKRGPYVGRWCSQTQSIVADAPDSDQD
jgi:hypothetical protein